MRDNLELVARPEEVHIAGMSKDLVCLTGAESGISDPVAARQKANLGRVYFIRAGRTNTVKIGWAIDPWARLASLQTGSPHKLFLVCHIPGTQEAEWDWHERWADLRIRGEWFKLSPELRHAINRLVVTEPGCRSYLRLNTLSRCELSPPLSPMGEGW